jgi:hypothetical protein
MELDWDLAGNPLELDRDLIGPRWNLVRTPLTHAQDVPVLSQDTAKTKLRYDRDLVGIFS